VSYERNVVYGNICGDLSVFADVSVSENGSVYLNEWCLSGDRQEEKSRHNFWKKRL